MLKFSLFIRIVNYRLSLFPLRHLYEIVITKLLMTYLKLLAVSSCETTLFELITSSFSLLSDTDDDVSNSTDVDSSEIDDEGADEGLCVGSSTTNFNSLSTISFCFKL